MKIYHFGAYQRNSINGMYRVIYSYAQLLADETDFHAFMFKSSWPTHKYLEEKRDNVTVHTFGQLRAKELLFPKKFIQWLTQVPKESIFHLHGPYKMNNYVLARILVNTKKRDKAGHP